jgi:hypothetical protein
LNRSKGLRGLSAIPWKDDAIDFDALSRKQCLRLGKRTTRLRVCQQETGVEILPDLMLEHTINQSFANYYKNDPVVA